MMEDDEARIRFPISCPVCRKETIAEYRTADIVGALINSRPIRLYAQCHDRSWIASYIEVQQIRAHLGAARTAPEAYPPPDPKRISDRTED
jgi:hypothetical protein